MMMLPAALFAAVAVLLQTSAVFGQDDAATAAAAAPAVAPAQPVCSVNQLFNGQICTCAPG